MSNLTKEELELFQSDTKAKSDWNGGIRWAKKQGEAKGLAKGKREEKLKIGLKMKEKGISNEDITELSGLSIEELELL